MVLYVYEKSRIQALDHTQPRGIPERRAYNYMRDGTSTLFAALNIATGQVIGQSHRRHRRSEFLQFLCAVDSSVPAERAMDNYDRRKSLSDGMHKTPSIKKLARSPSAPILSTITAL